jgi:DNA-binding MarR family transcriptional regulator
VATCSPTDGTFDAHGPSSVGFLLSQVGRSVGASLRRSLAPLDLDPRQYLLLRTVAACRGRSQHEVARALQIPPSRMVALVDGLEARRLLERIADPDDRRAHQLRLTPAGRRLLERARPVAERHETELCAPLSEAERAALVALVGRIAAHRELRLGDAGRPA